MQSDAGWGAHLLQSRTQRRLKGNSSPGLLPPTNFAPAGVLEWARHSPSVPPFINGKKRSRGRRRSGEIYELRAQDALAEEFGDLYVPSPWFQFKSIGFDRVRWCQPDGLLFDPYAGRITIIEMKLQHTAAAWWQVKLLYHPIIAHLFPPDLWTYAFVEIVKWFDKDTQFPERVQLLPHVALAEDGRFGVHIWKP